MDETIDELLPATPEAVRAILAQVRRLVRDAVPEAAEIVYHGTLSYVLTPSGSDMILYVAPQNGYVNLGFFFGAGVADPTGLLAGSGKRMRHVKIRSVRDAQNPALIPMVQEAWGNGVRAYAQLREARRKRPERPAEREA